MNWLIEKIATGVVVTVRQPCREEEDTQGMSQPEMGAGWISSTFLDSYGEQEFTEVVTEAIRREAGRKKMSLEDYFRPITARQSTDSPL